MGSNLVRNNTVSRKKILRLLESFPISKYGKPKLYKQSIHKGGKVTRVSSTLRHSMGNEGYVDGIGGFAFIVWRSLFGN